MRGGSVSSAFAVGLDRDGLGPLSPMTRLPELASTRRDDVVDDDGRCELGGHLERGRIQLSTLLLSADPAEDDPSR